MLSTLQDTFLCEGERFEVIGTGRVAEADVVAGAELDVEIDSR